MDEAGETYALSLGKIKINELRSTKGKVHGSSEEVNGNGKTGKSYAFHKVGQP